MGKTNKGNRTKGNTRPSSSGHSAQLLGFSGQALSGFIGFDALEKETPSYVPATGQHLADASDSTVDSDFRMVMRKMLKKDAVTRLKAVQEFGEHCVEKDKEIVKHVLPFWPRLFNKFALDNDRRIREATHHANGKLLSKVKREMAPYLKNIMGVWLLGQCDLYAPAASAAQSTFLNTFPAAKQSDAISFCKNEIFAYFKDNLFEQTAKTMSEPNTTTPEDMENKYLLVISATLQALKLFITSVQNTDDSSIQDNLCSITAENKFWKFAKIKEPVIRGSWFTLVSCLCQMRSEVFKGMEKKLATTIFTCLSESDPVVAPAIWECALSLVAHFENCWENVDIHKIVLPQLWNMLKEGGKGNARVLFPCLLPFLSKLPKDIMESQEFLLQFFSCFKQSLILQSVKMSVIECEAILVAFFECLQFMCCTRLVDEESGPELLQKILINEVVPLIAISLYDKKGFHIATCSFYPLVGLLVKKLESLSLESNRITSKAFSNVLQLFWQEALPILAKVFDSEKDRPNSMVYLSYFFNSVLQSEEAGLKLLKKRTVRFKDDEGGDDVREDAEDSSAVSSAIAQRNSVSFPHLVRYAHLLCDAIDDGCHLGYVQLLQEILLSAWNLDFIVEWMKVLSESRRFETESTICLPFVKNLVLRWLEDVKDNDTYLSIYSGVFIVCSFVPEAEALAILDCCCSKKADRIECVLRKGIEQYSSAAFFRNWLQNSEWSDVVLKDLELLITEKKFVDAVPAIADIQVYYRILNMFFGSKGLSSDEKTFESIMNILMRLAEQITEEFSDKRTDFALNFVHDILTVALKIPEICWKIKCTEKLIYHLFQASLLGVFKYSGELNAVFSEIMNSFIDSYLQVTEEIMTSDSLIYKMAIKLNEAICTLKSEEDAKRIGDHCIFLLSTTEKFLAVHKPELNSTLFVSYKLMDTILLSTESWNSLKKDLTFKLLPSYMRRRIFYPLPLTEEFCSSEKQTERLMLAANTVCKILSSDSMLSCDDLQMNKRTKFYSHYFEVHMPHILWSLTYNKAVRTYSITREETTQTDALEQNCSELLSQLPMSVMNELQQKLFELSSLEDGHWALCLQTLDDMVPCHHLTKIADEHFEKLVNEDEDLQNQMDSVCLIRQVLIHHLPSEKKVLYLEHLLDDFVKSGLELNKSFAIKMGEVCCYVQDESLISRENVQRSLKTIMSNIFMYNVAGKEDFLDVYNMQIMSILSCQIQYRFSILNEHSWKLLIQTSTDLIKECQLKQFDSPKNVVLLYEAMSLFTSISELYAAYLMDHSVVEWEPTPLPVENFEDIVCVFLHVADFFAPSGPVPEMCYGAFTQLLSALAYLPHDQLQNTLLPRAHHSETQNQLNSDVMEKVIKALTSKVRRLQFGAQILLLKFIPLIPEVVSDDLKNQSKSDDESDEEIEKIPQLMNPLTEMLIYLNEVVESMLSEVKIGDPCTIIPHTDSYHLALAYLLGWSNMLQFVYSSPSQIRLGYATHLEEKKLLSSLFANVFRFLPANPMSCLKVASNMESPKKEDLQRLFLKHPDVYPDPCPEEIQIFACYVFVSALRAVPVSIRTWWNNLDRRSADFVNEFTTKFVSGFLCTAEIQAVHDNEKSFRNLQVQARPGSREVIATYTIDDFNIELHVRLPPNYPLVPIAAERRGKVVVGQQEWRHWLIQLITVLTYQNGSILDGLNIWERNIDKKFEGVEECMICYYILHSTTLKLPKLSCHVCRKKFHATCLYKWFRTSNIATCPLCRNEFSR